MYARELINTDQIVRFEAIPWNENGGPGNDRVVYLDVPADEFKLVSTDKDSRGKEFYTYDLKTDKYRDEAKRMLKFGGGDYLSIDLSSQEEKDNSGKTYFSGDYDKKLYVYENNIINESKEEVEYLMGKFYEYRILAAEAGANGADAEYKDFSERAMEYHERAMNQMDADAAEAERNDKMVADYEEEEANREVPRDYASMYERLGKLAGLDK